MIASRDMAKKRSKRPVKKQGGNKRRTGTTDAKLAACYLRVPQPILRWVDQAAKERGLSRNQLVVMVLRATQAHFEAAAEAGLFKKLEAVTERAVRDGIDDLTRFASPGGGVR